MTKTTNKCLNCEKELIQLPHKREKQFCNSTCRSNYWQIKNRAAKKKEVSPVRNESKESKVVVSDKNKQTQEVKEPKQQKN